MSPAASKRQADLLKQEGNAFFQKERISAAIDAYTGAITLCPNVAVYWTNRALCYKKRNEWTKVEEDCRTAIQLENHSVKAHYMLGLALVNRQKLSEGIKALEKSLELGRGAHPASYMVEAIWQQLSKAKYIEWESLSRERATQLRKLKVACKEAICNYNSLGNPAADAPEEQLNELEEVFKKAAKTDTPTEVPDHLCCKITLDIFRDPVITPSGITYERAALFGHLHMVGKFDPVTREALEPHQLVPNLAIKEAVDSFLSEHGWAYKIR
ncbi:E3 ubiquitin-protein ligase CHIP-like [Phragmites australis]|uniref:E3 ubiquitin-protein ligase CHIP-like n=1 Tax=Phragmites australis TaxID=29695 RepID=UPI002D7A2AB1|nr:E3 ubiquitin-protein ligase CHIP-like [Phragmites australis]